MGLKSQIRRVELAGRIEYARQLIFGPDDPKTIPYLEASIRRFPKSADLRMLMADACKISRPERVTPEAKLAAELAPADLPLQVYAGWRLVHHGELAAAKDCAARVRELAGDDYTPMTDLVRLEGMVMAYEKRFAAAEEKLRWTVATEPENAKNAHVLAAFLWARGRDEEAVTTIDEAMWVADGRHQPLLDLRAAITDETAAGD
jgi:hypothetical protein